MKIQWVTYVWLWVCVRFFFSRERFATTKSKQYTAGKATCACRKKWEREQKRKQEKQGVNFNTLISNICVYFLGRDEVNKKTTMQFVVIYVFYHISTLVPFHCQSVSQFQTKRYSFFYMDFWLYVVVVATLFFLLHHLFHFIFAMCIGILCLPWSWYAILALGTKTLIAPMKREGEIKRENKNKRYSRRMMSMLSLSWFLFY